MKKEKIIFDVDPGVDDAMALVLSFNEPLIEVMMVTTTFGNVGLKQATKNACFVVENFAKKDIPVYMGVERGLVAKLEDATEVHGKTGLGTKIVAKNVKKKPSNTKTYGAAEAMRDLILKYPNEINILAVGPVTNVARLIVMYPEVRGKIKKIYLMVGSMDGKGSITPYSSFNAYCDPEAVDIVIKSGIPITLTTKELGTTAYFEQEQRERFRDSGKAGQFFYDLCYGYVDKILEEGQYAVHDSGTLFSILDTDIFTRENVDMTINTSATDPKRGQTKFTPNPNSHITLVKTVDKQKMFKKMEELLKLS